MESLNLMIDESGEFNEVVKKCILNGMRDYPQCFITIMAYSLMRTQDGELWYSISPMIEWVTLVSSTTITSMISLMGIWSSTEMGWRNKSREKWLCLQWMDRFPYRGAPTSHIRWIQTSYSFHPKTVSCQSQHRWQPVPAMISHSSKWRWTQDHCKS